MTAPLRILFVTDAFPPRSGGSGWSTLHLARGLRARGHVVRIVVAGPAVRMHETTYDDFPVWRPFAVHRQIPEMAMRATGLAAGHTVAALIRSWSPDVIHAQHVLSAQIVAPIARAIPYIVTVRDHWPVCFYGTALSAGPCASCLIGTRSPCNTRRGNTAAPAALHAAKAAVMRRTLALRADALGRAAGVTAVSRWIGDEIAPLVAPARLHIIPNAFDESVTDHVSVPDGIDVPERFFLYAGKLSPHKGADIIPDLMRALPANAPPLLVVGDGEMESTLRAADPTRTRIRVLGQVENTTVLALMARAVAFYFPSRWAEPLSRTLIEAQMMGCPVVATATGGTPETVIDGVTGYLTAADDVPAMAKHLAALANDAGLRARLSEGAQRRTRETFALPAVAARVEAVYRGVQAKRA